MGMPYTWDWKGKNVSEEGLLTSRRASVRRHQMLCLAPPLRSASEKHGDNEFETEVNPTPQHHHSLVLPPFLSAPLPGLMVPGEK